MRENDMNSRGSLFHFDLPFIFRTLKKWIVVILSAACIGAVAGFVVVDVIKQDSYTAEALVTVAAKDNSLDLTRIDSIDAALGRNVDMWNSDVLRKAIAEDNPDVYIGGSLYASQIEGSGLVQVDATASTARGAFYLLNAATKSYTKVLPNFDKNYRTVILTTINEDAITVSSTSAPKYGILGFLAGLMLSIGALGAWTIITDILHNESQARDLLDAPILGSLAKIKLPKADKNALLTREHIPIGYLEEIDMLTSRLEQTLKHEKKKMIMVTSVFENDGKSTVAANLALSLAKRDRHVLLVDLDLLHPSLWEIFGKEKDENVSISHAIEANEHLQNYIDKNTIEANLDVIWQFQLISDSDLFLENSNLAAYLEELKSQYDYIILDTPPYGPVRDNEVIARLADSSLLLMRQDLCHARSGNDIIDTLEEHSAPCMGIILNQCKGSIFKRRRSSKKRSKKAGKEALSHE